MVEVVSAQRRVTREEYREIPEGPPYFELIRGELTPMSRPTREHYLVAEVLTFLLHPQARQVLRGELAPEPNLYLPGIEEVYHPDFAWVARERRGMCRRDGIYGVPDLLVEILSPSTERRDRGVKLDDYERAGVPHVWLIDPRPPVRVEEYVLGTEGRYHRRAVADAPAAFQPAVFPGWSLPLDQVDAAVQPDDEAVEPG